MPKDELFKLHPTEVEANALLHDPNPLYHVGKHLDNIMAGEDKNKKALFVLLLSGKNWVPPEIKQMILLKGEPGAGKTKLMGIADLFNTKRVGRLSARALDYMDLNQYEVLSLREIGMMDDEAQGVSTIKFLSVDDMGYEVEVTERIEGGWTTRQYKIPPMTLITSTTRVTMDSQFERRAWVFNPDESEEQTIRIRDWKANHEKEKILVDVGIRGETSRDHSREVLKAVVRSLEPCKVIIPYIDSLFESLGTDSLRVRGDYDKILSALKLYGILLQQSEDTLRRDFDGFTYVFPSPKQSIELLKCIEGPLTAMQSGLEARTQKLIEPLKAEGLIYEEMEVNKYMREKIAIRLGLTERTIRKYLAEWVNEGYMSSDGKKPATYTLMYPLSEIEKRLLYIGLFSDSRTLELKMLEEGRERLRSYRFLEGEVW